jgi:exonuclease SbcD
MPPFKFLHTADLHLGKTFYEYSLADDQAFMLKGLECLLGDPSYRALIISGDVFDRSIPPQEAVELFGGFLGRIKAARPELAVLIIPGNHDSPQRLGYGRELFAGMGVHIACGEESAFTPVMLEYGRLSCACFLLPFVYPSPSRENAFTETARKLEAARKLAVKRGADITVLAAHLFCRGGQGAGSERNVLGQAEQVDPALFSGFDYAALGHLHRSQKAAPNAWYAGSPLAYSFDEAGETKHVLSAAFGSDTDRDSASNLQPDGGPFPRVSPVVTPLPVTPLRPLRRLSGQFSRFLKENDEELTEAEQCYLEISLSDGELTENALPLLRRRFPYLLMVRQDRARDAALSAGIVRGSSGGSRDNLDDFREFLVDIYGTLDGAGEEKCRTFAEVLETVREDQA